MDILTQIPIGSKLKVKASGDVVTLEAINNYPTRYETMNESGKVEYYRTHEVELLEVPEEN
ncbi:MAG: hypothetical protein QGF36_05485 [Candidatus Marinimicrobia bacterium]|jgi:hypothetical protein|nr:hypothetical protein [Candidatus Neomarinimicrobiota bacterium]MDP6936867.1 hypothetical protein [Candidatus Neomarinimicrobiota bacterium]